MNKLRETLAKQDRKVDDCPVCGQGQILVVKNASSGDFFVMCDDCESEWDSPQAILEGKNAWERNNFPVINATYEEIKNIGWDKYFRNLPQA